MDSERTHLALDGEIFDAAAMRARLTRHLFRHADVELRAPRTGGISRPALWALAACFACRPGRAPVLREPDGVRPLGWGGALTLAARAARDALSLPGVLARARAVARDLGRPPPRGAPTLGAGALYLMSHEAPAWGGAASHRAGVLAGLAAAGVRTTLAAPDPSADIPIPPFARFADFPGALPFARAAHAAEFLIARAPSCGFVYQRLAAGDPTGLRLARAMGVPFVAEWNGPEIWMGRHWGRPPPHSDLIDALESANLRGADLVVCVSAALADLAHARGVARARIVVAPNGVDTSRFSPDVDGARVRESWGWKADETVVGFAGSFGPWHGAETLARAFVRARAAVPELRLAMLGDGQGVPSARAALGDAARDARFAGVVAPADMPAHLAACDVLVSPQLPNPDGSPFFGSPTKLFEYMAMGRAIVASRLDQIADIVADGANGLLVPPGDAAALADALVRLARAPELRARLGTQARADSCARHTWHAHVARVLGALAGGAE